jgi:uncharacterized membrane protein YkoI
MLARMKFVALGVVTASAAVAQAPAKTATKPAAQTATYKKDIPDSLAKLAKVTEAAAAKTALSKVPNGKIQSVELEREAGKLLYSYDIKVAGKTGIEEVRVNAADGLVVGNVEHESPAVEKKEAAAEAKEKKAPARTKKPPR